MQHRSMECLRVTPSGPERKGKMDLLRHCGQSRQAEFVFLRPAELLPGSTFFLDADPTYVLPCIWIRVALWSTIYLLICLCCRLLEPDQKMYEKSVSSLIEFG